FAWIGATFIPEPCFDIELLIFKKRFGHFLEAGRPERINLMCAPGDPGVVKQRPVLEVMIGMVMCDEDVTQAIQTDACGHQLSRDSIPAIDQIPDIVDKN